MTQVVLFYHVMCNTVIMYNRNFKYFYTIQFAHNNSIMKLDYEL